MCAVLSAMAQKHLRLLLYRNNAAIIVVPSFPVVTTTSCLAASVRDMLRTVDKLAKYGSY